MPAKRLLAVQFQPRRARALKATSAIVLFAKIAAASRDVRSFEYRHGTDHGPYVNLYFELNPATIGKFWLELRRKAFHHRTLGRGLRSSSIVTCQGSRGWDNYRLLLHFDPTVSLDELAGI